MGIEQEEKIEPRFQKSKYDKLVKGVVSETIIIEDRLMLLGEVIGKVASRRMMLNSAQVVMDLASIYRDLDELTVRLREKAAIKVRRGD